MNQKEKLEKAAVTAHESFVERKSAPYEQAVRHLYDFEVNKDRTGSFYCRLFLALELADKVNIQKLAFGFPFHTAALSVFRIMGKKIFDDFDIKKKDVEKVVDKMADQDPRDRESKGDEQC